MPPNEDSSGPPKIEGLSAFIARILDQLAVTAWLPAAMLIGVVSLLVQLHSTADLDVPAAVERLATQPWGTILILLFALVLVTMITQAFSFEAIRLLEGYWSHSAVGDWATRRAVTRQAARLDAAHQRVRELERRAFESAKATLLQVAERDHVEAIEERVYTVPAERRRQRDRAVLDVAREIDWRALADPPTVALLSRAYATVADFPDRHRLLPTPLGNVIRAAEEGLELPGRQLEGFVMRNYDRIPDRLMTQHDQFRNRLEMYGVLVFVFLALAAAAVPLLATAAPFYLASAGGCLLFLALSRLSYQATVASGRGYGAVLLAMRSHVA